MEKKVITLRCVFGKTKEYHFQPGRMANGARYPWVKPVRYDAMGNRELVMSPEEMMTDESRFFIGEDEDIVVTDGTTFDLNDPLQYNRWMSIKDSDIIAPTRDARDRNGNLYIDGDKRRYGTADLYVEIPGEDSQRSVSRKQKILKAWSFIEQDSKSGRLTKCKLLGKYMENAPDSDVEDFLYQYAEKNPDSIIEIYTSGDMALRLLLIDSKKKGIIIKREGMYQYAENILGATDEAVLMYFKIPSNKRILDQIKFETYPDYAPVSVLEEKINATEPAPKKTSSAAKKQ